MRVLKYGLAALAAIVVASCTKPKAEQTASGFVMSPAVAEFNKTLDGLRKAEFKAAGGAQTDVNAIIAALPKNLSVQMGGQSFDAGSGATVLSKLVISSPDLPDVSLTIDEVKLWGLDAAFATARLKGERLGDTAALAKRIEAKGLALVGLDKAMTKLMNGFNAQMPTVSGPESEVSVAKYDVKINRVVMDNVSLRPFTLKLAELGADNPMKDVLPLVQTAAAYANSVAMDTYLYEGVATDMDMTQAGQRSAGKSSIEVIAAKGLAGGDMAVMIEKGITYDMSMTTPAFGDKPLAISGASEIFTAENVRFGKVLGYLATATMPPRTETDLLSLGLYRMGPFNYTLGGKPFMELKDATFDGTGFHWLIPTKLRFDVKGFTFHIDTLLNYIDSTDVMGGAKTLPAPQADVLKKYGLNAPSFDISAGWAWDAKAGAGAIDYHTRLAGWDKFDFQLEGVTPTFEQVSAQIPDTGSPSEAQQQALEKMFTSSTLLKAITFNLVDEGGMGKVFELLAEYQAADPNTPKGSAPTAKALRDDVVNTLNTQASQMKDNEPVLAALMGAFANFLAKGEAVHLAANPNPPVAASEFEKLASGDQAALDRLNITINGKKPTK